MPPVRQIPVPVPAPAPSRYDEMQDSMGDSPEQIAAESARLVAARQAARRQSMEMMPPSEPPVIENPTRRVPPHREAMNTADAVLDEGVGSVRAARVSNPNGDMETHRLDTVTLSERGRQPPPANTRVQVNGGPKPAPVNPRFRGK